MQQQPPQATLALAAASSLPPLSSSSVLPSADAQAPPFPWLATLQREADAMSAQGRVRWHPAHAQAARTIAAIGVHIVETAAAEVAAAAAAAAESTSAEVPPVLIGAPSVLSARWAPLVTDALLRLSCHPSTAIRSSIARTMYGFVSSLLQRHCGAQCASSSSSPPSFALDLVAEIGQAALSCSGDFDAAVASAFQELVALCGVGCVTTIQTRARVRAQAAAAAEEEQAKQSAQAAQAASIAAAAAAASSVVSPKRSKQTKPSPSFSSSSVIPAATVIPSPQSASAFAPTATAAAAAAVVSSPSLAPVSSTIDRRASVSSDLHSSAGSQSSAADLDDGPVVDLEDDAASVDDEDQEEEAEDDVDAEEVVEEEEDEEDDGAAADEIKSASSPEQEQDGTSAYRFKDGNRRLRERDESSSDEDEEQQQELGMLAGAPEEILMAGGSAAGSYLPSAIDSAEPSRLLDDSSVTSGRPAQSTSPLSALDGAESEATRPISDEEDDTGHTGPIGELDVNVDEADADSDAEGNAMGGDVAGHNAVAPATTRTLHPALVPLTPAQELASTSAYHALLQQPLSSSFQQHQFQQCLHHLTALVAAHPPQQPMDESWMSYVLLTTHAQVTGEEEDSAIAAAAAPSASGSASTPPLSHLLSSSRHLASFALLTSCAKYLIKHHLRSRFGAALPTLAHLDRVLTSNLKAKAMEGDSPEPAAAPSAGVAAAPVSATFASRLPLQRTLLFMDAFEKLITHASSGGSSSLGMGQALADQKARDFFAANANACYTFFARIRAKLVQASVLADMPAATVYHAQALLQPLMHALSHVWAADSDPKRAVAAAAAPPSALSHSDLLNHRQLLETVNDLSQAYLRLGNISALTALASLLQSKRFVLSRAAPNGSGAGATVAARPLSLFSLCFFLPAVELQARGRLEQAAAEFKRVLAECGSCWTADPTASSSAAAATAPLLVANSIALQACIQGLSSCHSSLGDSDAAAQDESWTGSVSREWEKSLAGMKAACPVILQPLLPASHTVIDVFRWRTASSLDGQNAATNSARILDRLAGGAAKLDDALESQALLAATQGLRRSIRSTISNATPPQDPAIPASASSFLTLNSEQQASLSDDLLLLAISQKLLGKELDSVPSSPDPLQLNAAYALTSWKDSAALSSALVQHRLPEVSLMSSRPSVLSTLAQLELPTAARTLLHVQCAAAVARESAADFPIPMPIAAVPSLTLLLGCDTFHSLRRTQLVAQSSQATSRSAALAASSLQISFVQHALHNGNTRLAHSMLAAQMVPELAPQAQLLSVISRFVENQDVTGARLELQKLSGVVEPDFSAAITADSLLPFTFKLSSLALPSSPSRSRAPIAEQSLSYLLEFAQQAGSDPRASASLLHSSVSTGGGSAPHFWQQHGRQFYIRALQLASMPAALAHLFDTVATEDDRSSGGAGGAVVPAPKSKRSKAKPAATTDAQSQWVDASEEANRGASDEDFAQIRFGLNELNAADASAVASPIAALTALVFAINSCLDSRVEDPPPGLVLVRSTSLTSRPAPAVIAPPSLSPAELSWFNRLREVLWQALCKALPQLVGAAGFDQFYSTMLHLACRRAVRLLAYAESALAALIQAQQLLANPTSDAYSRAHPAHSHAEMPLAILTLLTRFGSELSLGQSLVVPMLALAPKSFLTILPQLFARVCHPSPVVRGLLQALVCRIGEQFPHEVVFPLCVSMHEEEEWKRDEERCRDIEAAAAAAAAATGDMQQSSSVDRARSSPIVTPKHEMLLRIVHAIDRRSVSTVLAQRSASPQQLHSQVISLFSSSSSLPSSSSRGSFMLLLSSVHRLLLELNRLAFLQEDSWLWEFRRLQSELDFGGGLSPAAAGGAAAAAAAVAGAPGSRGRMVAEELENMQLQWREEQKRQAGVVGGPAAIAAAASKAPTPQLIAQLRARYDLILGPLLHQLLELQRSTLAVPAATPHELHFQRKYGRALQQLVSALVTPGDDVLLRPSMLWSSLSLKITDLRRTMSRLSHLHLASISPFLSKFHAAAAIDASSAASASSASAAALAKRALRSSRTNLAGSHVDPASNYAWYSAVHASHAPQLYLAGMQGTEDLYENSHPNPAASSDSSSSGGGPGCFLVSFSSSIELLRTKTRPKKLSLFGSDGATHTYLLKSREDLHLDQAMMQWIRMANRSLYQRWRGCNAANPSVECLVARSQSPAQQQSCDHICASHYPAPLYARTFSVIPLSDKSGLIKWIDGVVAIFDLVKHEQNRRKEREERTKAAALAAAAAGEKAAGSKSLAPAAAQIIKPSELFSHKLLHHLHAAGLHKSTARKDIPLPVLLAVFDEMQSEGGEPHLLQKELWLSSASPSEWFIKVQSFSHSLATMSLLGYILGLGDRHLGNMMLSPARGDVLHIDYNISLERGLKLPIPEIVPWRMTNVLRNVGGVAGVGNASHSAGNFAHGCLIVLSTVRAQEHMFSSLLGHRFVYAPLSEWKSLSAKPFLTLRKQSEMTLSASLLKARLESSVVGAGAASASSSLLQPVTNLTRVHDLARMVSPSEGSSLVLESVDGCFAQFGRLLPIVKRIEEGQSNAETLHADLMAIVSFQLLHSSAALQTLAEREPAVRAEMATLYPRIQGSIGAIGGLCASTATILSKQSALLHALAASSNLNVLWSALHAGRTESTDDAAGAANEVHTLVGPLLSDSRRFPQSFTHLSHAVTLLPVAFHPPSPHPSITLPAAALKADEQMGLLLARFKGALFELNALLVFYRHVSDIVVHAGNPSMPGGMPASPPSLQLQSATSSFVFHLLEEYLRAPLPPITPDSNKLGHTALLQTLAARLQGFHHQSHGSCIVLSPSHAFQQYSSLHSSLLSCHASLHRKFLSLESMLLHSLGGGGKVESGEDLNPARRVLPGSLQLAMYPPSLHQFVTRAREGYAKVCSSLSVTRSQMLDRFSSASALNQSLAAFGWSAPTAAFNLGGGSSSMMGGLQIVDDIAAQYAVDHVVNLLTCLQMWHWVQNLMPQLMHKSPAEAAPAPAAASAPANANKKQVRSQSASLSSPSPPAVAPMHPLVSTVTFFPLHTQLTLLLSSLCASTSFLGARFLHQEITPSSSSDPASVSRAQLSSNLVPSGQPAKVDALYDHRAFVTVLGLCSQLEDLVAAVPQQVANLFARAVDAAFMPQQQQQQLHAARPEAQWSHSSNALLTSLRHLRARLRVLLSTAHAILQEEVQDAKNAAYEAQRAAEAQAAAAAQASRLNYASAMRPKSFNAAPTPASNKSAVLKNKRAELALHMTQWLSEYEALKLPSSAALAAAQQHQQMGGPPPTFAAVFALLDSQYTRVELQYLGQVRFIAPWALSPHMYALIGSTAGAAAVSSSAMGCLPLQFGLEELAFIETFVHAKIDGIVGQLTMLAAMVDSELSASASAPPHLQRRVSVAPAVSSPRVLAELQSGFLDKYASAVLLPLVVQHVTAKIGSYLLPADDVLARVAAEGESSKRGVNIPAWIANATGAQATSAMKPTLQRATEVLFSHSLGAHAADSLSALFCALHAYTLQSTTLDASFHVMQSELRGLSSDIQDLCGSLPAARWAAMRFAWEASTPLYVAVREDAQALQAHQSMKLAEIESTQQLAAHQAQLARMISSMPSLHSSLLAHLHSIHAASAHAESDAMQNGSLPPEPTPLSLLSLGVGAGPVWKLGMGYGVELRSYLLHRMQTAVESLSSIEHELTGWSAAVYNEFEARMMIAFRGWGDSDRAAEAGCNRVIHEANQRCIQLRTQTEQTAPQVMQIALDILQLERYRLDPPTAASASAIAAAASPLPSSGPADEFLSSTGTILLLAIQALQAERTVVARQARIRAAGQEEANCRALAEQELQWLQQNEPSSLSPGVQARLQPQLMAVASKQLPRWSARCIALFPSLLPLLDLLTRLLRDTRSSFAHVARSGGQWEVGREASRLKAELEQLHALLTAFVQQQPAGGIAEGQRVALEPFLATFRLYAAMSAPDAAAAAAASADPSASMMLLSSSTPLHDQARSTFDALLRLPGLISAALSKDLANSNAAAAAAAAAKAGQAEDLPLSSMSAAAAGNVIKEDRNKHALSAVKRIQQKLCGVETVWMAQAAAHAANAASATTALGSPSAASSSVTSPSSAAGATAAAAAAASASFSTPLSVRDQVSLLISEATRRENLARLYEGWAPWI